MEMDPNMDPNSQEAFLWRLRQVIPPGADISDYWQEYKTPPPTPEPVPEPTPASEHTSPVDNSDNAQGPDSPPMKKIPTSSVSWPETGLAKGDRSKPSMSFCPWKMVKNYPHAFIGKTNAVLAKPFFDNPTIHKHHPWDVYYIYNPGDMKNKYILLVPTSQFEHLLDVINEKLGISLTIPGNNNAELFKVTFGMGGAPLPRFLGRSTSFEEFEALKRNLPLWNPEDDIQHISIMAQDDFLELLKRIQTFSKGTKSKKSEKNRIKRIQDHKSWGKSVKRLQRYLGIRKEASDVPAMEKLSIADTRVAKVPAVDVQVVAKPERGVVFVSIDIEAFEFNQDIITEIGVAVFDTLDIGNRPPGDNGKDWFPLIRGHHFRIKENAWATNRVHVDGHAEKFDFGKTVFVENSRIKKLVANIIDNPAGLDSQENKAKSSERPVVLVFHDSASDIKYLEVIHYDVAEAKNVLEIVDTRDMYQHAVKANNPAGLERVLAELNIPSRFLHNAGNDAVYTMQAMIGLAFKMRLKSLERARDKKAQGDTAAGKAKDDEGWATGGEDSDGGKPGEKGSPARITGPHYLQGRAFQPGEDVPVRAPSPPPSNVFSWSDNEDNADAFALSDNEDNADAEHLEAW
ncbi:hypothetical protein CONLIGDRAFT_165664 [Coniochaeta ligniaria NRRL 30616]|uniref:Gfd2/YDR514C-like C-terminal domain-containing protein n=1 Tax=Coniochaeta ligniaria NRRL 30616 TaxID=1408157 RepID=A0A1J7J184_9PEZI|nr:hypothetical protein CONLIGDRAFT_165664 [Coniochaeta ligniaria NRRL 30616]